ncbi:hypothetical protein C8J57DRAFT_1485552 [Mycena rebaudengoi]|nr:hypothetical protein C8J57DRAFT_1485552 [Mycena rebaudengoi]
MATKPNSPPVTVSSAPISYADRAKGPRRQAPPKQAAIVSQHTQLVPDPHPSLLCPAALFLLDDNRLPHVPPTHRTATSPALRRHSGPRAHYAAGPAAYAPTLRPSFLLNAPAFPSQLLTTYSYLDTLPLTKKEVPRNTAGAPPTRPRRREERLLRLSNPGLGARQPQPPNPIRPLPQVSWRSSPARSAEPYCVASARKSPPSQPHTRSRTVPSGGKWAGERGGYEGAPGPGPMPTTHFRGTRCDGVFFIVFIIPFSPISSASPPRLPLLPNRRTLPAARSGQRAACGVPTIAPTLLVLPRVPRSDTARRATQPHTRTRPRNPGLGERVPRPARVSPEYVRRVRVAQAQRAQSLDVAHGFDARGLVALCTSRGARGKYLGSESRAPPTVPYRLARTRRAPPPIPDPARVARARRARSGR